MTVVAAIVSPTGAWMGADSLASDEELASTTSSPKIARFGNLLLGFAGSWRAGQQFLKAAGKNANPTLDQLLDNVETDDKEWSLLVIEQGKIYEVNGDRGIIEARKVKGYAYGAIGTGASAALGALYANHTDESDLMIALEAAQEHTTNVRGPFTVLSL
jgi:ATP-dependent protease HslVU (ClpYQ) peptidase subunit